jgi:hypothetical protein
MADELLLLVLIVSTLKEMKNNYVIIYKMARCNLVKSFDSVNFCYISTLTQCIQFDIMVIVVI